MDIGIYTQECEGENDMYENYGYFENYEDINARARELLTEGNIDGIKDLARENGIEDDIVEVFATSEIDFICDAVTAAIGKVDIESSELQPQEIFKDWIEYIKALVLKDNNMALAVRKENKTIKGCISKIVIWSLKNSYPVDAAILKAANAPAATKLGIPGMGTAKKLIREYYMEDK